MDKVTQFYEAIKAEMGVILATAADDSVTMRLVSPVYYKDSILIFTEPGSTKYKQLKTNPNCCISTGNFYAEAKAEFFGSTMLDANKELREVYDAKFHGAFDEGVPMGGRDSEFIIFKPTRLTGWAFENDIPTPEGIPSIPFDIKL